MKNFTRFVCCLLAFLLTNSLRLSAQETHSATQVTIVQKVVKTDGSVQVIKKEVTENELAKQLETLKTTDGKNVEIHLTTKDGENVRISKDESGTLAYFREANPRAAGLAKISENTNWSHGAPIHSNRPILGIYPDESSEVAGVKIGSLSTSKGVAAAGLKAGDVITAINGKTIGKENSIREALASQQPGDKVTVQYLRDGKPAKAEVTLAKEGASQINDQRDPCRVFIGVGTSTRDAEGLHVDYIVENTPAETSDVRPGDLILSLDNIVVRTQHELEQARDTHQPGEAFSLNILREGKPMTINATFKKCSAEELQKSMEEKARRLTQMQRWNYSSNNIQRDTCKVFIGVYTHKNPDGQGIWVNNVIENTPAKISGVQKGDIILALDDVKVNGQDELLKERNKHEPGERFTLSILRQGQYLEIDAQFKSCAQQAEAPKEEIVEKIAVPEPVQPLIDAKNELQLEVWNAYPNPTLGLVNVQFRAAAVPTIIQVTDATGKKIYEETLNRFDGTYNKPLNLEQEKPGIYIITVRQSEQIFTRKLVLLAKA